MKKVIVTAALVTLLVGSVSTVSALDAQVYVAHGINGTDLGLAQELSVDVFVEGVGCALPAFTYGTVTPSIALPAGQYDITISLSDGNCGGPVAVTGTVDLAVLENATIVAHLNEEGSPTITKYTNDLRATAGDRTRLEIRHNAAAPPVVIRVNNGRLSVTNWEIDNGGSAARELGANTVSIRVKDFSNGIGTGQSTLARIPLDLRDNTAIFVHAVGSLKNGTFTVLPIAIPVQ